MHNVSALDKQRLFAEFLKIFNEPIKAAVIMPAESTGLLEYSLQEHKDWSDFTLSRGKDDKDDTI